MASIESLFSFEVAVEYLRIDVSTVACRFPAVAVRLLEFPTLLLPQLEKPERNGFRTTVLFDSFGEVPLKFKDLLDSKGNFQFNKGKSCMFKFVLDNLHKHLHNVPLYIMVTDLWGDVAKLVGVCTIPLNNVISHIKEDVDEKGISYPSVHGGQDTYPVFNLMGSHIGVISMGYRLLSLGQSLLPHIPATSILQDQSQHVYPNNEHLDLSLGKKQETLNAQSTAAVSQSSKSEVHDIFRQHYVVVNDDEDKHKEVSRVIKNEQRSVKESTVQSSIDQQKQTNCKMKGDFTETSARSKKERFKMETGDIAISNTHCPPPLFFNAKWDKQTRMVPTKPFNGSQPELPDSAGYDVSLSESSESYHSKMMEVHYTLEENSPESIRKVVKDSRIKKSHRPITSDGTNLLELKNERKKFNTETLSHNALPVLTALLQELSLLTSANSEQSFQEDIHVEDSLHKDGKENVPLKRENKIQQSNTPSFRNQVDVAPHHQHTQSCRHKLCLKPSKPVPSAKGWLRQEPVLRKRETKLQFKMTYSQKLRLKKNNPELLKTIEAEENLEKKQSFLNSTELGQNKTRKKSKKKDGCVHVAKILSENNVYHQHLDVPTEVSKHDTGDVDRHVRKAAPRSPSKSARTPVPTPRMSGTSKDLLKLTGISQSDGERASFDGMGACLPIKQQMNIEDKDFSTSERSFKSIEVFIPNPTLIESDKDSDSESEDETSEHSQEENSHTGLQLKEPCFPGFPSESVDIALHVASSNRSSYTQDQSAQDVSENYSDNFDESRSSYHTPRDEGLNHGEIDERAVILSRERSASSPTSCRSHDSTSESERSGNSRSSSEDLSGLGDEVQAMNFGQRVNSERTDLTKAKDSTQTGITLPKPALSGFALPRPPLSASSPVPQQRPPLSKIVLTKPVSVNDDDYNESGEVNLPSDLSISFESHHRKSLESSQDVTRERAYNASLDVIKSEAELKDSENDGYSVDFVSELDDSDNFN